MYERFTDPARAAMKLSNQEAQRFHHEYIGTEHIVLGLVKEGSGLGVSWAMVWRRRAAVMQPLEQISHIRRRFGDSQHAGLAVHQLVDRIGAGSLGTHDVDQKPRIEIPRARGHYQAGRRRECHRGIDGASFVYGGHARAGAEMREDDSTAGRLGAGQAGDFPHQE